MSNADGAIIKNGKILGYFEYFGTSDIAISMIYSTYEELINNNRQKGDWNECKCGKPAEEVILYTNYGGGFHWQAKVCLYCKAIMEGCVATENITIIDGLPKGIPDPFL